MNYLMDENIPREIIDKLRLSGHDAVSVKEVMKGYDDKFILDSASIENRIIITQDKDFGELIYRDNAIKPAGIILIRLFGYQPNEFCSTILGILNSRNDWAGHFTVIRNHHVRMIPL